MPSVTSEELEAALVNYSLALTSRSKVSVRTSKDLVELDSWYRNDLKTIIADRRNEKGKAKEAEGSTYLTREDLGRLMEWKLARGKWRPRLLDFALGNSDELVKSSTLEASLAKTQLEALNCISKLKGCGPATSSAVLALFTSTNSADGDVEIEPFMSDEAYALVSNDKPKYTVKDWEFFSNSMKKRLAIEEKNGWTHGMEGLEQAAFSYGWMRGEDERVKKEEKKSGVKGAGEKRKVSDEAEGSTKKNKKSNSKK